MDKQDKRSPLRRKLDNFWSGLFLTPEGKPKSAMLLYSFCLCLLFFAVYLTLYLVFIDIIEGWLGGAPRLNQIVQAIVPALLGTVVCCALSFIPMDKRLVPVAYLWLVLFAVAVLIAMAIMLAGDGESFKIFFALFAQTALPSLVFGVLLSELLYWRKRKKERDEEIKES